jgi:hypothetical protein
MRFIGKLYRPLFTVLHSRFAIQPNRPLLRTRQQSNRIGGKQPEDRRKCYTASKKSVTKNYVNAFAAPNINNKISVDNSNAKLLQCDDRIPPLYADVPSEFDEAVTSQHPEQRVKHNCPDHDIT